MNELQQISSAFADADARGEATALATVVAIEGSAYRQPGARMLVADEGQRLGSVSGGCLERDVVRHACRSIASGQPVLRLYDSLDEDLAEGFALGCNGAVLVLVEPAGANVRHQMAFLDDCLGQRRRGAVATVYATPAPSTAELGARVSQLEGGEARASGLPSGPLRAALEAAVADALQRGHGGNCSLPTDAGPVSALIEVVTPPLRVMVFGAGLDGVPLVDFGRQLGWSMQVVASAGGFGTRQRFRGADALHIGSPDEAVAALRPDGDTVALLMSHNFPLDVAAFRALVPCRPRYIGLLGPRHRARRLLDEAQAQGAVMDEALRARIFGPVGLDIGAETPAEVALAIAAEINATLRQRGGASARRRQGPLHAARPPVQDLRTAGDAAADTVCALALA